MPSSCARRARNGSRQRQRRRWPGRRTPGRRLLAGRPGDGARDRPGAGPVPRSRVGRPATRRVHRLSPFPARAARRPPGRSRGTQPPDRHPARPDPTGVARALEQCAVAVPFSARTRCRRAELSRPAAWLRAWPAWAPSGWAPNQRTNPLRPGTLPPPGHARGRVGAAHVTDARRRAGDPAVRVGRPAQQVGGDAADQPPLRGPRQWGGGARRDRGGRGSTASLRGRTRQPADRACPAGRPPDRRGDDLRRGVAEVLRHHHDAGGVQCARPPSLVLLVAFLVVSFSLAATSARRTLAAC
jgi:hypothetical protein